MTLIGPVNCISEKIKKFTSTFQQKKQNEILSKIEIINPEKSDLQEEFAKEYLKCRAKKPISIDDALQIVKNPLVFSALLVRLNYADGTVGGAVSTTSDTVRTATVSYTHLTLPTNSRV